MPIITLTTDLGHRDFYLAKLKGRILSSVPNANIVDITHDIPSHNIPYTAFVLKNAYLYFPKGTIHLIGVDTLANDKSKYIAVEINEHLFVGTDNGIFTLMFQQNFSTAVEIDLRQSFELLHFPLADILTNAVCLLANGKKIQDIGFPIQELQEKMNFYPVIEHDRIVGTIIYVDKYGNSITNITKILFDELQNQRQFKLSFGRGDFIERLSWHYNEVPESEKLCLFGVTQHLEIAINKGSAEELLGLKLNQKVVLEFTNNTLL